MEDDPRKRRPDISVAKTYLKWEPKVSFQEAYVTCSGKRSRKLHIEKGRKRGEKFC
jgi:hypothetical protein